VPHLQVSGVDQAREAHHPVGHAGEILHEVKVVLELVVGGAGWVRDQLRGMVRNKEVIICLNLLFIIRGIKVRNDLQIGLNCRVKVISMEIK
jgi:hypothetical protein